MQVLMSQAEIDGDGDEDGDGKYGKGWRKWRRGLGEGPACCGGCLGLPETQQVKNIKA